MKISVKDYEVRIWYSPESGDECFVAQVLDLPGVMAHGDTREDAAREIETALKIALKIYAENGEAPPPPTNHAQAALSARGGARRTSAKNRTAKKSGQPGGQPRKHTRSTISDKDIVKMTGKAIRRAARKRAKGKMLV